MNKNEIKLRTIIREELKKQLTEAVDDKWKKSDYSVNKIKNLHFDLFQKLMKSIQVDNAKSTPKEEFDFIWESLTALFNNTKFRDEVFKENNK